MTCMRKSVEVTLVFRPLRHQRNTVGAALRIARANMRQQGTYPELLRAPRCRLVVLDRGRWTLGHRGRPVRATPLPLPSTVRTSPPACQQHRSVGAAMVWVSRLCSCQVFCSLAVVAAPPRRCRRRWLAPRPQRRARRAPARQPATSQSPARTAMCIPAALHTYPRSLQCAQGPDRRFRAVAKRCV